jgi:hypothetical protein
MSNLPLPLGRFIAAVFEAMTVGSRRQGIDPVAGYMLAQ